MSYEFIPTYTYEQQLGTDPETEPEPPTRQQTTLPTIAKWGLGVGAAVLLYHYYRMRRNPDDEDILAMLTRYQRAGMDISELLKSLGASKEALEEQAGLAALVLVPESPYPPRHRESAASSKKILKEKQNQLFGIYEQGMNVPMLAKKLDISSETAFGWLSKAGHLIPDKEGLIKSYKPGMSISRLAKKHGVDFVTARRWLIDTGVYKIKKGRPGPAPSPKKDELIAAYKPGMNVAALARAFGVGSSTADRWLKEAEVYVKIDPFEGERRGVLDTYEPSMSTADLAKEFGVSREVVDRWLRMAGLIVRSRSMKTDPLRKKVVSLYIPGMNVSELAKKFNILPGTLITWLAEEGVYVPGAAGRKRLKDQYEKVISLYQPGMNVSKIAREVGVTTITALNWLKKAGIYNP